MRINNDDFSTLTLRYFDRIFARSRNMLKPLDVVICYSSKNSFTDKNGIHRRIDKYGIQIKTDLEPRSINTK